MKTQNELVKELFSYLDIRETSGSGYEFRPVYVSCGRCMLTASLGKCLESLRSSINQLEIKDDHKNS